MGGATTIRTSESQNHWLILSVHLACSSEPSRTHDDQSFRGEDMDLYEAKRERISQSYRSIGFRRLANTCFFCLPKDPAHRSRQISADQDADIPHVDVPLSGHGQR